MKTFVSSLLLLFCLAASTDAQVTSLSLATNALVYDPISERVYASVPARAGANGNSIAVINPHTASVERYVWMGLDPRPLALSDDGSYLYVGLDGQNAVRRLSLPTLTPDLLIESTGVAMDIAVMPGAPRTIATVWSAERTAVAIYDDGVQRPASPTGSNELSTITFSEDGSVLYAYDSQTSAATFSRLAVTASGLTLQDKTYGLMEEFGGRPLIRDRGRLVTRSRLVDPQRRQILGSFPQFSGEIYEAVAVSPGGDRVYVVASWPSTTVRAVDASSFRLLWVLHLPDLTLGIHPSMVACGPDRLCLRDDARGAVQVIDLANSQNLTISKEGGGDGHLSFDPKWPECSGEDCVGRFQTGTTVALHVTPASNSRFVGWAGDPDCNDGMVTMSEARACTAVFEQLTTGLARQISLNARDLVYSPLTDRLYASVPGTSPSRGNTVTVIDPATGTLGPSVWVGSEPGRLAVSSDGGTLYVGLDGASAVRRLDLASLTPGLQFPLRTLTTNDGDMCRALAMVAVPGDADSVVISRGRAVGHDIVLFTNGVPRSKTGPDSITSLAFGSPSRLYAADFQATLYRLDLGPDGLTVIDSSSVLDREPFMIRFADGRLFTDTGHVVDPETPVLLGHLPLADRSPVVTDAAAGKAYYLDVVDVAPDGPTIKTLDPVHLTLGASVGVTGPAGPVVAFVAAGSGRLAYVSQEQVVVYTPGLPVTDTVTVQGEGLVDPLTVSVTPADADGRADGTAPFSRRYLRGTTISLSAPAAIGPKILYEWRHTAGTLTSDPVLALTVTGSDTVTARYRFPTPTVTSVSPAAGPLTGGTDVVITGHGFRYPLMVAFGAAWSSVPTVVDSQTVIARAPASQQAGVVQVKVVNPDYQSGVLANAFTYLPPATVDALAADVPLPAVAGRPMTWTASAHGGFGTLEYQFWLYSGATGAWAVLRDWSTTSQATWTPAAAGTYAVQAWVRSVGSTARYEGWKSSGYFTVTLPPAPVITGLAAQPAFPLQAGTTTQLTATATGGVAPLQYKFWVLDRGTGTWSVLRDYDAANTVSWTPAAGKYAVQVWVRGASSTASWDAWLGRDGWIAESRQAAMDGLEASPTVPVSVGTTVLWTARAHGGTAPLQYQFWLYDQAAGTWSVFADWSTASQASWTPSRAGKYAVQAWVRSSGSTARYEAWAGSGAFAVTPVPAPQVTSVTMQPALPVAAGTTVEIRAVATGGVGPLQYRFWLLDVQTGTWSILREYDLADSVAWTPSAPGRYSVQVWVRNAGSTAEWDAWRGTGYVTVTGEAVAVTSLRADHAFPSAPGTTVTWDVTASGATALEYQFWLFDGRAWAVAQDYGVSNRFTWTPSAAGTYALQAWVRRVGSTARYDAWAGSGYFVVK